jgi:hypothetical protein
MGMPLLQAILLALDRRDREREMASVLLAGLHPKTLSEDSIAKGFTDLMLACEVSLLNLNQALLNTLPYVLSAS